MHPTRLGKYEILEEIARGAYGLVFRARDTELGRIVAVKRLREEESDAESRARFVREAQVAARLQHPNIVRIFEAGDPDGVPWFVMELVEGLPLTAVIYMGGLDARATARLFEKVARAVHAAHERDVVHRDLKPGNILVRDDGDPVVMDFGIAHDARRRTALTRAGELLGTPQYMAPEQISGRGVDARSDVYAIGAVMYEQLTKRCPFDASGFAELSMKVLNDPPPHPTLVNPFCDDELARICMTCLEKRPEDRFATAAGLAEALSRVARALPPAKAAPPPPKRRPIAWLGIVGAMLMGALAADPAVSPGGRRVDSDPPGASIYVDGRFAGVAPAFVQADWLTLKLPGRADVHARGSASLPATAPPGMTPVGPLFVDDREVSIAGYAAFVEATGARAPWRSLPRSRLDEPVTGVTWDEASAFAAWSRKRLPTAAEWRELAACPALTLPGGVQEWASDARGDFRPLCGGSGQMAETGPAVIEWRAASSRLPDAGFRCVRDRLD
jgi:tRNA A-37 threonylcarbamoyl transferase component Bud32